MISTELIPDMPVEKTEYLQPFMMSTDIVIDEETGEISKETKVTKRMVGKAEEFYQIYASIIPILETKCKPIEAMIFISTFSYASRDNQLALTKQFKQQIATKNGISYSSVGAAITNLVKIGLLIRSSYSTYRINPRYFWKSTRQHRKNTLEFVLKVECPEC